MTDNRDVYFERMTNNFSNGTKTLLPMFLNGKRVLDVGVGSGTLGRKLREVYGNEIEINGVDMRLDISKEDGGYDNLVEADFCKMTGSADKYDTIYFSSVMHEIGSYADKGIRGTAIPIVHALQSAHNLLADGGVIVIRDGLADEKAERDRLVKAIPSSGDIKRALRGFKREFSVYDKSFTHWYPMRYVESLDTVMLPGWALKEFMATYTWGEGSWPREIKEQFCYMSASEWRKALNNTGFDIVFEIHSPENYEKFCGGFFKSVVDARTGEKIEAFPDMTITIVAKKI